MTNFLLVVLILVFILLTYLVIEHFILINSKYQSSGFTDILKVHFIHGSYPKKDCNHQRKRVGGLLGGHIEVEIDEVVYGFEFEDEKRIHFFS